MTAPPAAQMAQWAAIVAAMLFIWHCPIFKPYFGFRRPNAPR